MNLHLQAISKHTMTEEKMCAAKSGREWNYDLLRFFAIFQVVLQHVSMRYGGVFATSCIAFSKTTIPLFVMLSGAFIIADGKNGDYRLFFNIKTKRLIIATIVWSVIYVAFTYTMLFYKNGWPLPLGTLITPLKQWAAGYPFYHLWFLYMFVGVYAVAPLFIWIREKVGERNFAVASAVVALLMIPTGMFSRLFWVIKFVPFLGYFMLGYTLRCFFTRRVGGVLLIAVAALSLGITIYILRCHPWWLPDKISSTLLNYQSATIFVAAVCLFKFFGQIKVRGGEWLYQLSKHSFNVYLLHPMVISTILITVPHEILKSSPVVIIPLMTLAVMGVCYAVSIFLIRKRML